MSEEQPETWARELANDSAWSSEKWLNEYALKLQRAFAEREEHARAERRNIISHATMGSTTGEGMSVNDICVEITRQRNKLYQAGKNSAEAELVGALERIKREARKNKPNPDSIFALSTAALKSREAGHG